MALRPLSARVAAQLTQTGGPFGLPLLYGLLTVLAVGAGSGLMAYLVARLETKGMVAAVGALGLGLCLLLVRDRPLLLLMVLVMSLQVLMHKALGPLRTDVSGGPLGVYIMTIDVVLVLLYAAWLFEGTLFRDLSGLLSQRAFVIPLVGALALIPSFIMAADVNLAVAEIVRFLWAYVLYVYVALRVRTRQDVGFLVAALFVVAAVQCVLVAGQWWTGSSLGLSFLGEQSDLGVRTLDDASEIPRPSGTMVHSVVLGAVMGPIALMGLSLAINLQRWWLRLACLLASGLAVAPMALAQTRGAAMGLGVAGLLLVGYGLWSRRISWRPVAVMLLLGALAAVPFWDKIEDRIFANIGTDHFSLEIDSRLELNGVAIDMAIDSPLLGVGLNNFETAMGPYDRYGLIFFDNPVHNLFLLILSEAGIVGLIGQLAVMVMVFLAALRLARVQDRFLQAVGIAITMISVFYVAEEMLMFSLRHDMPRTLYWLLAGLALAGWRIAQAEQPGGRDADVA